MHEHQVEDEKRRWTGYGLAFGLRRLLTSLEVRVAHYDRTADPAMPEAQGRAIYVFWHEYITFPIALWGHYNITMLASQHRDADWLIGASEKLGFGVVRGSTNRGGTQALRELKRASQHGSLTITPDGPRGPRRQMALGPVYLASRLGLPVVPVGFGYRRAYRFGTWDRFALPYPFTRGRAIVGPKMFVPRRADRDALEFHRQQIEHTISGLTQTAEDWARHGGRMKGEVPFRRKRSSEGPGVPATVSIDSQVRAARPISSAIHRKSA